MQRGARRVMLTVGLYFFLLSLADGRDYEIRLSATRKAGEKCHVSGERKNLHTVRYIGGGDSRPHDLRTSLKAEFIATILKVNDWGAPIETSMLIKKLTKEERGVQRPLLKEGTVVAGSIKDGKEVLLIDGQPVGRELYEILSQVNMISAQKVSDDKLFGTKERKKVGDSWPINAGLYAKELGKQNLRVDAANIEGKATLNGVVQKGGQECLDIGVRILVKNPEFIQQAPGVELESGKIEVEMRGYFPVGSTTGRIEESLVMTSNFRMKGPVGPAASHVTMEVKSVTTESGKTRRL